MPKRRNYPNRPRVKHRDSEVVNELVRELELAREDARVESILERKEVIPDFSRVYALLNDHPQLMSYIATYNEKELARQNALLQKKGSPTGSHPQAQGAVGLWGSTRQTKLTDSVANAKTLRDFADLNEWVRAAINIRRTQLGRADIAVVPANPLKKYNKGLQRDLERMLRHPNEYRDSYRSLIEPVLEDILVLDRGCISKSMSPGRRPKALYYEDGASIKIYPEWDGNPKKPRYVYEDPFGDKQVPLRNDECIVIMANPATHRYSLSPVQVLRQTISADLAASKAGAHAVDMKPPPHLIQIPGASLQQINQVRDKYDTEIAGRKEIFWMGGDEAVKAVPLVFSARDSQWLEWQEYLAKKIAIVFQISPQQLGLTFDINKATGSVQQQIFEDTGLIPLLLLIEEYLNRELLADFAPVGRDGIEDVDSLNLRIVYPEVSEASRQMHSERAVEMAQKGLAGLPSMTINQVLAMRGEPPVKGGNTFYLPSGMPLLSYDGVVSEYMSQSIGSQDPMSGPIDDDMVPDESKNEMDQASTPGQNGQPGQASQPGQGQAQGGGYDFSDPGSGDSGASGKSSGGSASGYDFSQSAFTVMTDVRGPGTRWAPWHNKALPVPAVVRQAPYKIPMVYIPIPLPAGLEKGTRFTLASQVCTEARPNGPAICVLPGASGIDQTAGKWLVTGEFEVVSSQDGQTVAKQV